jgi:hypothetical protein
MPGERSASSGAIVRAIASMLFQNDGGRGDFFGWLMRLPRRFLSRPIFRASPVPGYGRAVPASAEKGPGPGGRTRALIRYATRELPRGGVGG